MSVASKCGDQENPVVVKISVLSENFFRNRCSASPKTQLSLKYHHDKLTMPAFAISSLCAGSPDLGARMACRMQQPAGALLNVNTTLRSSWRCSSALNSQQNTRQAIGARACRARLPICAAATLVSSHYRRNGSWINTLQASAILMCHF